MTAEMFSCHGCDFLQLVYESAVQILLSADEVDGGGKFGQFAYSSEVRNSYFYRYF